MRAIVTVLGCVAIAPPNACLADPMELATPQGLSPGDRFQFVFVTTGSLFPTSSKISVYDKFVNNDVASSGGATYNGTNIQWYALVGAQAPNNSRNPNSVAGDFPLYLTNGTEVSADSPLDQIWNGDLLHAINANIYGSVVTFNVIWTGSNAEGFAAGMNSMGMPAVTVGYDTTAMSPTWISDHSQVYDIFDPDTYAYPIYAVSAILTVPLPAPLETPEPSTILIMAVGMTIMLIQCGLGPR